MSALTDVFSNIANAIRTKTGGSDTYTPYQMPDAITNIAGANYDGAIALNIAGNYTTGEVGDFVVGNMVAFDSEHYNNMPSYQGSSIYFGNDLEAGYTLANSFATGFSAVMGRGQGYAFVPVQFDMNHNFAGMKFVMPESMASAEYLLGNASYWGRDYLPDFVFRGNTDIRGIFCGIPSWGGFQLNIYHPNIEDYISTVQNNSLFGSTNKPFSGWGSFSWTKTNDNFYKCSEFNVALIRLDPSMI